MRASGVQDALHRQIEGLVVIGQTRHRRGCDCHAVIAAQARDDLLFLGLAERVRAIPDHLDDRIVRLGARVGIENLAHWHGGYFDQLFSKINRRTMRAVREVVVVGQLLHLPAGDIHKALFVEPDCHAPKAGHALDIAVAV